jgi:hypothetical protein
MSSPTTEDPRVDALRAFELHWQTLVGNSNGALDFPPERKLGFLTFADFREAMKVTYLAAYAAGRESL